MLWVYSCGKTISIFQPYGLCLVVLNENRGALSWRLMMSDKKFDFVYICAELIELTIFKRSLPCDNKNFNCNTCTRHLTVYKAYSHACTVGLHKSPVEQVGIMFYRRGNSGLVILIACLSFTQYI